MHFYNEKVMIRHAMKYVRSIDLNLSLNNTSSSLLRTNSMGVLFYNWLGATVFFGSQSSRNQHQAIESDDGGERTACRIFFSLLSLLANTARDAVHGVAHLLWVSWRGAAVRLRGMIPLHSFSFSLIRTSLALRWLTIERKVRRLIHFRTIGISALILG